MLKGSILVDRVFDFVVIPGSTRFYSAFTCVVKDHPSFQVYCSMQYLSDSGSSSFFEDMTAGSNGSNYLCSV